MQEHTGGADGGVRGAWHGRGCGLRAAKKISIFFSIFFKFNNARAYRGRVRGAWHGRGSGLRVAKIFFNFFFKFFQI